MQALVKYADGPGHIEVRTVPDPVPGPGQVMVEVKYAGICGSDLHIQHWDIQLPLRPPMIMGHECSGAIAALGEGVTGLEVGQEVTSESTMTSCGRCMACRAGHYNMCVSRVNMGFRRDGCFARYVAVPAHCIHALPEGVDLLSAALTEPLACVVRATLELTCITPADTVVVAGPGTIGLLALQTAVSAGAYVVVAGVHGDGDRLELARELGASVVVDVTQADLGERVRALTSGEGADVYLECSGAPASARAGLQVLRRRGQFCLIGLAGAPFEIDFATIAYKELHIAGSMSQTWSAWKRALALMASGDVATRPLVSHVLPLSEWEKGFRLLESRVGTKIVLTP